MNTKYQYFNFCIIQCGIEEQKQTYDCGFHFFCFELMIIYLDCINNNPLKNLGKLSDGLDKSEIISRLILFFIFLVLKSCCSVKYKSNK